MGQICGSGASGRDFPQVASGRNTALFSGVAVMEKWQLAMAAAFCTTFLFLQDFYLKLVVFLYPTYEDTEYLEGGTSYISILRCAAVLGFAGIVYLMRRKERDRSNAETAKGSAIPDGISEEGGNEAGINGEKAGDEYRGGGVEPTFSVLHVFESGGACPLCILLLPAYYFADRLLPDGESDFVSAHAFKSGAG